MYEVIKEFQTSGVDLIKGEVIPGNLKLINELVSQQYLMKLDSDAQIKECKCGRKFASEYSFNSHLEISHKKEFLAAKTKKKDDGILD